MARKKEVYDTYLNCKVSPGLYRSERIVVVKDIDGREDGGAFDQTLVKENKLKVDIIKQEKNRILVGFSADMVRGLHKIWVSPEELSHEPQQTRSVKK